MNAPELWIYETRTGPDTLQQIRETLASVWRAHADVPDRMRSSVEIATGEIAANIVEHAASDRPVELRMEVLVLPSEVQVRFIDDGNAAFAPDLDAVHLPHETAERGRGLAVAKAALRELSYQRDDRGNRWTLISERFSH